jgi:hypothetical protein
VSTAPRIDIDPCRVLAGSLPHAGALPKEAPIAFVPQLGSTLLLQPRRHFRLGKADRRVLLASAAGAYEQAHGPQHDAQGRRGASERRKAIFPTISPKTVKTHWTAQFQAHADRIIDALEPRRRSISCRPLRCRSRPNA